MATECGGCGGCGGCGVCGSDLVLHEGVCPATRTHAPNWVAEHLGASSRRPRHPFPALMAGEPQAVYLCTRPKKAFPSHHELQLRRSPQFSARLDSMPCHNNNGHVTQTKNCTCARTTNGHVSVQIHLPLLTATLVLQREPGKVVVVWANIVLATEPVIQHAHTLDELLVLEIIEEGISSQLHTVPNRIVGTTRRKTTTTRHRDANTLVAHWAEESGQSAYVEHVVTTDAVATMEQPTKETVNDTKVGSATGAVNTNVPLYFPLETGAASSPVNTA